MGAELEANWAVTDALQLYLSYSYLDTEIKDDRCFIDNDDTGISGALVSPQGAPVHRTRRSAPRSGSASTAVRLPSAPKNKVALNANYTWYMPAGNLTFSGNVDLSRRGLLLGLHARPQPRAGLRRDRSAPAVERAERSLHDHRVREERVRSGRLRGGQRDDVGLGRAEPNALADVPAHLRHRGAVPVRQLTRTCPLRGGPTLTPADLRDRPAFSGQRGVWHDPRRHLSRLRFSLKSPGSIVRDK